MKTLLPLLALVLTASAIAQGNRTYPRTYSDGLVRLTLDSDSTFTITQSDPVFPYNGTRFKSKGICKHEGKNIVLNPQLEKRAPVLSLTESYRPGEDSVRVRINYSIINYENERPRDTVTVPPKRCTVYLNSRGNNLNLVNGKSEYPRCLYGPRIRNEQAIDSIAIARFKKRDQVRKIGIRPYGFEDYVELVPKDPQSNCFEITIVQPVDSDRKPRGKKVRVHKREAYYYEHAGRFIKLAPLYLQK